MTSEEQLIEWVSIQLDMYANHVIATAAAPTTHYAKTLVEKVRRVILTDLAACEGHEEVDARVRDLEKQLDDLYQRVRGEEGDA